MRRRIFCAARTKRSTGPSGPDATGSRSRTCSTERSADPGDLDLHGPFAVDVFVEVVLAPRAASRVPVELVVERLLADAERLRRPRLVVLQPAQRREDVLFFDLAEREAVRQFEIGALAAARRELAREMLGLDGAAATEDDGALQRIAQLADVSRPGIVGQQLHRLGRDALQLLAGIAPEAIDEVLHEDGNVLTALLQRREVDVEDVEAEVQVLAESRRLDLLFQIAVRGADHAHVDRDLALAAEPAEALLFEDPEELRLQLDGDLADLVEEESAPVRELPGAQA